MQVGEPACMVVPAAVETYCKRLPLGGQHLHVLCPAGLGDCAWIYSKFWSVCEERQVTFWLPAEEQHRADGYFRVVGARYGFMPRLSTVGVWELSGMPEIPDSGGVINVHPNRHLENGIRIDRWYQELPFKNPWRNPNTAVFKTETSTAPYVVAFMSHPGYMMGNLMPGLWARMLIEIENRIGPVLLIGADDDVPFVRRVCEMFSPTLVPLLNAPVDQVLAAIRSATAFVGVAAGISILSTYAGVPTVHLYPRNLAQMPGMWEEESSVTDWCFMDDAPFEAVEKLVKLLTEEK